MILSIVTEISSDLCSQPCTRTRSHSYVMLSIACLISVLTQENHLEPDPIGAVHNMGVSALLGSVCS